MPGLFFVKMAMCMGIKNAMQKKKKINVTPTSKISLLL